MIPQVLATDLDGTLIPLDDNPQNERDLRTICERVSQRGMQILFVTGRHLASVQRVMLAKQLPQPDWIIGDVGTSIYRREEGAAARKCSLPANSAGVVGGYSLDQDYAEHLGELLGDFSVDRLAECLGSIRDLRPQEVEKQTRFKHSYYVDRDRSSAAILQIELRLAEAHAPYTVVASHDPFSGDGLIDLLPRQVTKAYAIGWWSERQAVDRRAILYAGDSGNDSAVFAAGYRSIIVSNASADVLQAAQEAHANAGWKDRIYAASKPATSGVLDGLTHFCLSETRDAPVLKKCGKED